MPLTFRDTLFWAAVACCTVASLAILRSVVAPARPSVGGEAAPGPSPTRRAVEVAYALVPALALGVVLALTWPRVRDAAAPAAPAARATPRAEVP
jgi:hypothetical protein